MPTYPLHCFDCDEDHEVFCKISERDDPHKCPKCGLVMERRPTTAVLNMKGKFGMKAILSDGTRRRVDNLKSDKKRSDN